jgi:hypothetical protein
LTAFGDFKKKVKNEMWFIKINRTLRCARRWEI